MFQQIAMYAGYLSAILTALALIFKPIREKMFGMSAVREGQLCLLRTQILEIYYKHEKEPDPALRQFERENLDSLYAAYAAEGGNTFVKDIYEAMRHWRVIA